jgi:SAM-dependent methyltransferase/uncharacterized protein YbaR (Trm112 family)
MRERLIEWIACPVCGKDFELLRNQCLWQADEVMQGTLCCRGCDRQFPIIQGVPRLLPDALMRADRGGHAAWRSQHSENGGIDDRTIDIQRTMRSFGFQWNTFSDMFPHWEADFLDYLEPLKPADFRGKLGLDAGCGFGRHIYHAAKFGAEMVGLDLSEAVVAAHHNTRGIGQVHIVQGDIFHPPFKPGIFDLAYSIGVLHHTPSPRDAFASLTTLVRPGGTLSAWIYGARKGPSEWLSVALRAFTTRMNYRALYALCTLIGVALRVGSHYPCRIMEHLNLERLGSLLPLSNHRRYPFRVVVADAFDRLSVPLVSYHSGEELAEWFRSSGCVEVKISQRFRNNESWRGTGKRLVDVSR